MNQHHNPLSLAKETAVLTMAVASGCLLFSAPKPCICQQYFRPWHCTFQLRPALTFRDHDDLKRVAPHHRFLYLRKRIRRQNCLHQHYAPRLSCLF